VPAAAKAQALCLGRRVSTTKSSPQQAHSSQRTCRQARVATYREGEQLRKIGHSVDDRENTMRLPSVSLLIIGVAAWIANSARAQDRVAPPVPVPPNLAYPAGSEMTFEWVYYCDNIRSCFFSCSGSVPTNNVLALQIYLGTIPLGNNPKTPALFYFYSTMIVPRNNGFRISSGIRDPLFCDVVGMTLEYSGPPK
jgi:hypothetical protein